MSRIGKKSIEIPDKVEVKIDKHKVTVNGPKGSLARETHPDVTLAVKDKHILFTVRTENRRTKSVWGLTRTLVSNMVHGVTHGFSKNLEINGVGYKAVVEGKMLKLSLGLSHGIDFPFPAGIDMKVVKNLLTISSMDKEQVGRVAAIIREMRPPEPYKGTGVKYVSERIVRKAGKTGAKAT
jgi:large subunit ribosomal protein L6